LYHNTIDASNLWYKYFTNLVATIPPHSKEDFEKPLFCDFAYINYLRQMA
jgi:hypothetical protein